MDLVLQEGEVLCLEPDNLKLSQKLLIREEKDAEKPNNFVVHNVRGMKKLTKQRTINQFFSGKKLGLSVYLGLSGAVCLCVCLYYIGKPVGRTGEGVAEISLSSISFSLFFLRIVSFNSLFVNEEDKKE